MLRKIEKLIDSIEKSESSLKKFVLSFFFVVLFRNFLEIFSNGSSFDFILFSHYAFFYISLLLSLILLVYFFTKEKIESILKVLLLSFSVIILPPIVDLLFSSPGSRFIDYFMPGHHQVDIIRRFFLLGGEYSSVGGITLGIKFELILVIIFSFIYLYIKKKKIIRAFLFSLSVYSLIFLYFSLPIIFSYFYYISDIQEYFNYLFLNIYFIFSFFQIILISFLFDKSLIKALFKDLRYFRLTHYITAYFAGLIISFTIKSEFVLEGPVVMFPPLPIVSFVIMIVLAWSFSVIVNNIEDIKTDSISNNNRPLFNEKVDKQLYKKSASLILYILLAGSSAVGFIETYLIFLFIGFYYIYSVSPFRLKRVSMISKIIISLNTFFLVLAGYLQGHVFNSTNNISHAIRAFPENIILMTCPPKSVWF